MEHDHKHSETHRLTLTDESNFGDSTSFQLPSTCQVHLDVLLTTPDKTQFSPACLGDLLREPTVNPNKLNIFKPIRPSFAIRDAEAYDFIHDCVNMELSRFVGGFWSLYRDINIKFSLGTLLSMSIESRFIPSPTHQFFFRDDLQLSVMQLSTCLTGPHREDDPSELGLETDDVLSIEEDKNSTNMSVLQPKLPVIPDVIDGGTFTLTNPVNTTRTCKNECDYNAVSSTPENIYEITQPVLSDSEDDANKRGFNASFEDGLLEQHSDIDQGSNVVSDSCGTREDPSKDGQHFEIADPIEDYGMSTDGGVDEHLRESASEVLKLDLIKSEMEILIQEAGSPVSPHTCGGIEEKRDSDIVPDIMSESQASQEPFSLHTRNPLRMPVIDENASVDCSYPTAKEEMECERASPSAVSAANLAGDCESMDNNRKNDPLVVEKSDSESSASGSEGSESDRCSSDCSEPSFGKRRSLWIPSDSESDGDSDLGAEIVRRLRGERINTNEEQNESGESDDEDSISIIQRMREARALLQESDSSDESEQESGAQLLSRMRTARALLLDDSSDEDDDAGVAIARSMRESQTTSQKCAPDESEELGPSTTKRVQEAQERSDVVSTEYSLNFASSVTSEAVDSTSLPNPCSSDGDRSFASATNDTISRPESSSSDDGAGRLRSKSKKGLRKMKSRRKGSLPSVRTLTNKRDGRQHTTISMGGKYTETPELMDLMTRNPVTFWMIDGPDENQWAEEENEAQVVSGKYAVTPDGKAHKSHDQQFTTTKPGPKARIGLISPLQKTVMSITSLAKEPDYIQMMQPISFKRTVTKQLTGFSERDSRWFEGSGDLGEGSGDDLGSWKRNDTYNNIGPAGEKFSGQATSNIACLSDDATGHDRVGEGGNRFQPDTHNICDYDRGRDMENRDYDGRNGAACSNGNFGFDREGNGMYTGKVESSNGEEDDERGQESSFAKLRRYDSYSGSASSDEEWRREEVHREDGRTMTVCRRASYDTVVNRAISEVVHNFSPNRFVLGVSRTVKGCPDADDRNSDESEEERLFREAVTVERGVTQKRLNMSDLMMADLDLELENTKHEHVKTVEYMKYKNSKTENELVRWIERLEVEKMALLEMVNDQEAHGASVERNNKANDVTVELKEQMLNDRKELNVVRRENERLLRVILRLKQELDIQTGNAAGSVEKLREMRELQKMVELERNERHRLEKLVEEIDLRGGLSPSVQSPSVGSPSPSMGSPSVRSQSPIERVRSAFFGP